MTNIQGPQAVEFDAGDVCAGAAARGESQREAMDAYRAACMEAIRADPELDAQWQHDAEMAQHAAENLPSAAEFYAYDRERE